MSNATKKRVVTCVYEIHDMEKAKKLIDSNLWSEVSEVLGVKLLAVSEGNSVAEVFEMNEGPYYVGEREDGFEEAKGSYMCNPPLSLSSAKKSIVDLKKHGDFKRGWVIYNGSGNVVEKSDD